MNSFNDYEEYDGLGLAELVRNKEVMPSELVEAAISRINLSPLNHTVFCLIQRPPCHPIAGIFLPISFSNSLHSGSNTGFKSEHILTPMFSQISHVSLRRGTLHVLHHHSGLPTEELIENFLPNHFCSPLPTSLEILSLECFISWSTSCLMMATIDIAWSCF